MLMSLMSSVDRTGQVEYQKPEEFRKMGKIKATVMPLSQPSLSVTYFLHLWFQLLRSHIGANLGRKTKSL